MVHIKWYVIKHSEMHCCDGFFVCESLHSGVMFSGTGNFAYINIHMCKKKSHGMKWCRYSISLSFPFLLGQLFLLDILDEYTLKI